MRYASTAFVFVGLMGLLTLSYRTVRENEGSFSALLENYVLAGVSFYLLFFLVLLVLRYAVFIIYSFLDHLENLHKQRNYKGPRYREENSLPMVSVVVPVFNEGMVIQPALRALLELD